MDRRRRCLLGCALLALPSALAACARTTAAPPLLPPRAPAIRVAALTDLLAAAGLRWLVVIEPQRLLALPWLKPSLDRILRDERLDLLAAATGLDLRATPEVAIAAYGDDDVVVYLARHQRDPIAIERLFRQRLTGQAHRSTEHEQLVRVSGSIGRQPRAFVAIGPEVVGFQYGGNVDRGPARVALLYAAKRLRRSPTVTAEPTVGPLWAALGAAPLRTILLGPFDERLAGGARGLLDGATGIGAAATPTDGQALAVVVLIGGDFTRDAPLAQELLEGTWADLARSDLGNLLGLGQPRSAPRLSLDPQQLRLDVELDPALLCDGLAAATTDDVREIMR